MLLTLLISTALAAPLRPEQVPSPRASNSWVADLADVLSAEQEQRIDRTVAALQAELGAEVAVATVAEIEGSPKDFATDLFNLWGVGDREANNGVLLLMVVDARRVEIETGYGIEGILSDGWLGRMMDADMVPRFKADALGEGLVAGVEAVDARLRQTPEETRLGTGGEIAVDPAAVDPWPHGGLSVLVGAGISTPLMLGGGLLLVRRRRRQCPVCKKEMELLSEEAEDAHLDDGQQAEEQLGSINYEVRVCPEHGQVRVLPRTKWFAGYVRCRSCSYKTSTRNSRTIVSPTYTQGGTVEVVETCRHCGFQDQRVHTTPRKTRSTSSSGGGGYSSGGGSFGGGSSGGGGAGRSW